MTKQPGGPYRGAVMEEVNVHQAKTHLSRLLHKVEAGEEVVISRAGDPVAKLVPIGPKRPRVPGRMKGRVRVGDDFDDPLPEDMWTSDL